MINLEVGKSYVNSLGDKVEIIASFVAYGVQLFAGITTTDETQFFQAFRQNGEWHLTTATSHNDHKFDIVGPYVEKYKGEEVFIIVNEEGARTSDVVYSKEWKDNLMAGERFVKVKISEEL